MVAALTSGTPARHELAALYRREQPLSDADLVYAAELVDLAGGRDRSQTQIGDLLAQAMRELQSAHPLQRAAGELGAFARRPPTVSTEPR